jgi:hypothetical protein
MLYQAGCVGEILVKILVVSFSINFLINQLMQFMEKHLCKIQHPQLDFRFPIGYVSPFGPS